MLEKSASFVLGSSKSSTYPKGYASGFDSPAASLDSLFEHPVVIQTTNVTWSILAVFFAYTELFSSLRG